MLQNMLTGTKNIYGKSRQAHLHKDILYEKNNNHAAIVTGSHCRSGYRAIQKRNASTSATPATCSIAGNAGYSTTCFA